MGPRTRFGDGDGTFWDKWVSAGNEKPGKGLGYDENRIPLRRYELCSPYIGDLINKNCNAFILAVGVLSLKLVSRGFTSLWVVSFLLLVLSSRMLSAAQSALLGKLVLFYLFSYLSSGPFLCSLKLEREGNGKESYPEPRGVYLRDADWQPVEKNRVILKQNSLPPIEQQKEAEKKPKKLISSDEDSDSAGSGTDTAEEKEAEPEILPAKPIPNLTFAEKEIYFGDRARAAFFDAYRHISRQQSILSGISPGVRGVDVLSRLQSTTFEELAKENEVIRIRERNRRVSTEVGSNLDIRCSSRKSVHRKRGYNTEDNFIFEDVAEGLSRTERLRAIENNKNVADTKHEAVEKNMQNHLGMNALSRYDSMMVEKKAQETHLTRPAGGMESFLRPGSPRTRYLTGCLKHAVAPRPNLIIRKDVTSVLNIEYQYIGDTMAVILANSLEGLPYLTELNVAGNKLTDVGLTAIINALPACPSIDTVSIFALKQSYFYNYF